MGRVVSREEAHRAREAAREAGEVVVFTNGCFDLLHRGHVDLLQAARDRGDLLIVGVNDDGSVQRLKGADRPLVAEADRAAMLVALSAVDLVVLFAEDTPLELIRFLSPDVLVKGADYRLGEVVGGDWVREKGGRVELVPLTPGQSSSELIRRREGRSG
jgi:rfaE bifunctional protein nucleotidyltransferase chain/domain